MVQPMNERIEEIELRRCRGATGTTIIPIEADKPLTVVFGENGTGKSTITDALDMVCNERCGSLDGRSGATARLHTAAIGSKASEVRAAITIGGKTWTAKLNGSKIVVDGPQPRPTAHVLRRHHL